MLIYYVGNIVTSVGDHYAQPQQLKISNEKRLRKEVTKIINKKTLNIDNCFNNIQNEFKKIKFKNLSIKNKMFCCNYKELFDNKYQKYMEKVDIIYLDPPYNWRQYDSNYHLLNTIAKFNEIKDKQLFQNQIVGASGENRVQKLKYTSFNTRSTFKDLLLCQLAKTKCKYVILSYSDSSSNHEKSKIYNTINEIESFFANKTLFKYFKTIKIKSQNFESRKGNKKEKINELLFIAEKI